MIDPKDFIVPSSTIIAAAIALIAATKIVSTTKISEFRQQWINDLRDDIAEYVGKSEIWFNQWIEQNSMDMQDPARIRKIKKMNKLSNEARVILWRIRLRFNPRVRNRFKQEDDKFLNALLDLLDPGKVIPPNLNTSWRTLADEAVTQGREILKREWEVTKGNP